MCISCQLARALHVYFLYVAVACYKTFCFRGTTERKYPVCLSNCSLIKSRGSCFEPNTVINHASVVMNLYYKVDPQTVSCWFKSRGLIAITDPSNSFF
ncbi:hypothetical protein R3W88_005365 [Solanum pinnatisectum]|uniref:X8 domain-containing protein n=1 Tax=Solanum pinnatisectum TaxID=50273 RepID=A0AAV9KCE8_9SOLN|nr:hypothetical protein R3W88_005365 [Solanum pinnatisectum]